MTSEKKVHSFSQQRKILIVQDGKVAISHNHTDTGEAVPIIASLFLDPVCVNTYIGGVKLYDTLAGLNAMMQNVPGWRMRITNRRRYAFTSKGQRKISGRFFVDYFALDTKDSMHSRIPRKRIDVINLDLLREKPPKSPTEQLEMCLALFEMTDNRGVKLRGTRGAIGTAMLKASPYWEKGRYAAPKFVNSAARKYLPGNFYSLSSKVANKSLLRLPHCYYIDQTSAHHNIAQQIELPHPQAIHHRVFRKPIDPRSEIGQKFLATHIGLLECNIDIGTLPPSEAYLYPPWAQQRGRRKVYVWTPELRLLADRRLQLDAITASFTATTADLVLPEYARWSLREIASNIQRAQYKKGSLLAAYGMLAFNGAGKTVYRYWGGNNSRSKCEIPGAGVVSESVIPINPNIQLSTVNVIARGMIEAETRTRSIEYARELHRQGFHVPQIYADGVLVETDSLPFVREGWRISHSLTNVHIPRSNAIISDQIVKLPGAAGGEQDRAWERTREASQIILPTGTVIPTETVPMLV